LAISLIHGTAQTQVLSPGLSEILNNTGYDADSSVSVVIFLNSDQPERIAPAVSETNRHERIVGLLGRLKGQHGRNYTEVENFLAEHSITQMKRFWVVPAYAVTLPLNQLDRLAAIDGVRFIVQDAPLEYNEPVEISASSELSVGISDQLQLMNVPAVWNRGIKGSGRLVCSFDTGVEQSHPALADKWRGNHTDLSAAWFSSVAPDTLPYDARGHGTHTMGIMVGAMEADSFGVAPDAEWITAGVIDQGLPLQTTFADIIDAYQWALNPDDDETTTDDVPDVILNSWGIPKGMFTPCDETFSEVIAVAEAAGIVTVFAAGNEGPDSMTMRSPADLATTPLNSFSVGAINNDKVITSFSSRGPSSCDQTSIKPEVVACGYQIRSSQKGGGFAIMSGTSMAAPYIAGMVALARQYNPEATVTEIKTALMQSAEDLGATGEDNTYGYGLPDAELMLQLLPSPAAPEFSLSGQSITDDGIALPGETVGLRVSLINPQGNINLVTGRLSCDDARATIVNNSANFNFGSLGTTATNVYPYTISIDSTVSHGAKIEFGLKLYDIDNNYLDSLSIQLSVGYAYVGSIADINAGRIEYTVSDFGQYGLAEGSIYQAGGLGFRFDGSDNLLYEAGLVVGRNALQLSRSVRDSLGQYASSDFAPTVDLYSNNATSGEQELVSRFVDTNSDIPIPISIRQSIVGYDGAGDYVICEYVLENYAIESVSNLFFGFFADFDLSLSGESCVIDADMNMLYHRNSDGLLVGIVGLKNLEAYQVIANESGKGGFTSSELYGLLSSGVDSCTAVGYGDYMFMASSRQFDLAPYDTAVVAFALVAGSSEAELYANITEARQRYDIATDVDDFTDQTLPTDCRLSQNYPNPFNPTTTIAFEIDQAQDVALEVFNSVGQKVRTLTAERLSAGYYEVEWDGRSGRGDEVASGVYFYRLQTETTTLTRKMVLLK